jgi:hypothetical protein
MSLENSEDKGADAQIEGISSRAAFEAFLQAAKAVAPGVIGACCADVVLTY